MTSKQQFEVMARRFGERGKSTTCVKMLAAEAIFPYDSSDFSQQNRRPGRENNDGLKAANAELVHCTKTA